MSDWHLTADGFLDVGLNSLLDHAKNLYSLTIENSWSVPEWARLDLGSFASNCMLYASDLKIVELNYDGHSYD